MKTTLLKLMLAISLTATGAMSVQGLIPDDADGDGVPDSVDVCPGENSSGFDRDGDGCIDDFIGARHIEYWGTADTTITYVINSTAAPNINDGSDITAVRNAVESWPAITDTDLDVVYGGTVGQQNANALDRVNLVTFVDATYNFSTLVLAVGLSTSFEADTLVDGRVFRKGEIFDADMLFNPSKTFTTAGGPGVDIQSVATHEAGHLFGLSHSAVRSSTMFYVLPGGTAARNLESDDRLVYFKGYGGAAALAASKRIQGTVTDGNTSDPVPGAIVFIIDSATGDTTACDFTLADGTFSFPGLETGSYYVSIHALDGTSAIGFIEPGNINALVAGFPPAVFNPESYDAAESNTDDPSARTAVSVNNGSPVATANVITNVDATAPVVLSASPANDATGVAVDGAYVIQFSEAVELNTIQAAFSFRDVVTGFAKGGNIAVIHDDSLLVFTPSPPLAFSTQYRLRLDTDLEDRAGNPLASDFTLDVTTEAEPPLSISSLAPNKGVPGTTVVITGQGFDPDPAPPAVVFGALPAAVSSATVGRLVVTVPDNAVTGPVTVTNADLSVSNALTFTVLTSAEVARGYESGQVPLPAIPNAIAVVPSGDHAYIAGDDGAHAVVVNPALQGYLSDTPIAYASELSDIAATATGTRVYAVSTASGELVEINSDPTTGLLFNTVLSSHDLGAAPKGIAVSPTGQRAYITTDAGEVQVWDIQLGSIHYQQQVGAMLSPLGAGFVGPMAIAPAGDRLLALTDAGSVAFYDLAAETLVTDLSVGLDPKGIAVDPAGERAYATHGDGDVSVLNLQGIPFEVQDIATGGSLRHLVLTPAATYVYVADRELDQLKIIDLDEGSPTFRSVVGNIPAVNNPVDMALSPGGEYAFSVLQGGGEPPATPRMLVTTIGIGPALQSVAPLAAPVGAEIVLAGREFGDPQDNEIASVNFNGVIAPVVAQNQDRVVVVVPVGATSGPVRVRKTLSDASVQESNALFFNVFTVGSFPGIRSSVLVGAEGGDTYRPALAIRPQGDAVFVGTDQGNILAFDTRPGSPTFHQSIGRFLATNTETEDVAVSADGKALFVVASDPTDPAVLVLNADPNSPLFGEPVTSFQIPGGANVDLRRVEASPDNQHVVAYDNVFKVCQIFDATGVADGTPATPVQSFGVTPGTLFDLEFNTTGLALYAAMLAPDQILVVNTNVDGIEFGLVESILTIPGTAPTESPLSLGVSPSGAQLYALTQQLSGPVTRSLFAWSVDPISGAPVVPTPVQTVLGGGGSTPRPEAISISPRGDTAVRNQFQGGVRYMTLTPSVTEIAALALNETLTLNEFDFDPTGSRLYFASTFHDSLRVFEFATAALLATYSGNGQEGVAGELLPVPLRVRVTDALEFGFPVPGVSLRFRVTGGGGALKAGDNFVQEMVVATDFDGFAEVEWQLGPPGTQTAECIGEGILGSPQFFFANASPDPESLPLTLAELIPIDGSTGVSATTAVLATFNRVIDPATIGSGTFFIAVEADATLIPVTYGFTDGDRKVSMTPTQPLAYNTAYRIHSTAGIMTPSGSTLTNPDASFMETGAPPPLSLLSISPPSALVGVTVTLSGTGFDPDPADNSVSFNGVTATPVGGSISQLQVKVPATAIPGPVTVTSNAVTSNALNFTVLVPNQSPIDDVIATIGTGSGAKSCTVTPDGALCYTVSADGDVVIPVDVAAQTSLPAIPVGDQPVAIVMHPQGKLAYVANFNSSSVSVIDTDSASPTFNTVLSTITVGSNPADLAVLPDGGRVLVANAGSGDVSVIDSDESSLTFHAVIATVGAGSGAKAVTVSADGARIYIGTATGFVVMTAGAYDVVSTVGTGSGAKGVTVTPDGSLLFILTTAGTILVVDITPGSETENQVISTVGSGSGAKAVTVSADGALLYVVLEDSDTVLVIAINVIPGVSVTDPDATAPSFTVETTVIHSVEVGSDPSFVAVDPSGTGRVFVTNAGDRTLTIINGSNVPQGPVQATIEVSPRTLNLNANGKYVTGDIELALPFFTAEIVVASVRLQGVIPPVPGTESLGDSDGDGIQNLVVKFDRAQFQAILPQGEYVPVTITGDVRDRTFAGEDTIRTLRPTVTHPHGAEHVMPGSVTAITWTTPDGFQNQITAADVHLSKDNGTTWTPLANHIPNTGSFDWTVPTGYFPQCRILVTLWKELEVFGQGMSQDPFSIEMPVALRIKSFDASVEDGDAVLRWETTIETGIDGFRIVRSDAELGAYEALTAETIPASGMVSGASYVYRDTEILPNRTYWYKLVEVTPDGAGSEFGPYSVSFRLVNGLEQNMPNPFNPATAIKYSIAEDANVRLVVYDVAGRRVRTLVDQRQRADVYRVTWDGVNDHGERVASGVYFYKFAAGKYTQTRKMTLLK